MHGGQVLSEDRLAAQKLFGPWVNLGGRGWPPQRSTVWPVSNSWESLDGQLSAAPTLATRGANCLDAFVRGTDSALWQLIWNGDYWSSWQVLGGSLSSRPAAVAWSSDRLDVFAAGDDQALYHT